MAKFGENSSSFKIWQSPEEVDRNRLGLGRSDLDGNKRTNCLKDNFRDSGEKEMHKMTKFGASTSNDLSSTKTPENTKIPEVPNAPTKLHHKRLKKIRGIPQKLQFCESENENVDSLDSGFGVECDNHRYPTRSKFQSQTLTKPEKKIEAKNFNEKSLKKSTKNCDKENDCNVAKKSQQQTKNRKGISKLSSNLEASKNLDTTEASYEKEPLKRQRSMCQSDDWKEHLRWLQPRRDVGIWIECCRKNCQKWRYIENYHDPVDVPKIWYCEMNIDKQFANCEIPQQEIPPEVDEELITNAYNAGSIVWARLNGYPWWPAMVDDCPYFLRYYETSGKSKIPCKYHVTFFSKEVQTAWIPLRDIKPYATNPRNTFLKKTIFRKKDYSQELDIYCAMAAKALPLTIFERLKKFSYISRISEENSEKVSKKKREATKNQTIRIRSRKINLDADIDANREKFLKSQISSKIQTENEMSQSPINSNEHLQNEILQENSIDISKSQEITDKSQNIEVITIDDTEEMLEPQAGTSRGNLPKRMNSRRWGDKSYSLVAEALERGEESEKMLKFCAGFDAIRKRERLVAGRINNDQCDRRESPPADHISAIKYSANHCLLPSMSQHFKTPMEVDSDSPSSFSAEEFMPRPSNNMRIKELSATCSNFHSSFDEANQGESLTMERRESNFVNDRNSSIGFSFEEFEPRPSRSSNSFRNFNSQFEFPTRSSGQFRFGGERHFSNHNS